MIDTNLLLSIGFSMVTNFAHLAEIPDQDVPKAVSDLRCGIVGTRHSPTAFGVYGPNGSHYWIEDGFVQAYGSSLDFFVEQEPSRVEQYLGDSILNSNQVVVLVSNVLQRLLVDTNLGSLKNHVPIVTQAGHGEPFNGKPIPFFEVQWPNIYLESVCSATVRVDGRSGKIVHMILLDIPFWNPAAARRINQLVLKPDAGMSTFINEPAQNRATAYPHPTDDQVGAALSGWPAFCAKLGLNVGNRIRQTNRVDMDWLWTRMVTNAAPGKPAVCRIVLTNGATCAAIGGTVTGASVDWGFRDEGVQERADRLGGTILKDWRELATNLVRTLQSNLGIPAAKLAPFEVSCRSKPREIGLKTMKRVTVEWRIWPPHPGRIAYINESQLGLIADFDLETGELKGIEFYDQALIDCLARAAP